MKRLLLSVSGGVAIAFLYSIVAGHRCRCKSKSATDSAPSLYVT